MVDKHTVSYHHSHSQLISRIYPLIFLWTLKGTLYIPPWLRKSFKFIVLRLLVIQKIESVHFCSCSQATLPQVFIIIPLAERNYPFSGDVFSSARTMGGEDYGVEKITKIKTMRVSVTSFDEFHHLLHFWFMYCCVII